MVLPVRTSIGGLGNLLFKQAYILSEVYDRKVNDSYVQDYRLWADKKWHIKEFFDQGVKPRLDKVGLHIRRGDYLKAQDFHTNLWSTTDYYQRSIARFPTQQFLIFCLDRQNPQQDDEDREWCRTQLRPILGDEGSDWEMAPVHEDETEDLNLFASCNNIIGANSTFSWWAAFLGEHDKVIMPKAESWFVDGKTRCPLPPEWTTL